MEKGLLSVLAVFLVVSAAGAAPLDTGCIPTSTQWILHIDFDTFRASQLGQLVMAEIKANQQDKIDAFAQLFNIDLTTDISSATIYGQGNDESKAVFLLAGNFDKNKILALLILNKSYSTSEYNGYTLHHWVDENSKKSQVGTFAEDGLIVVAQSQEAVQNFLDVHRGQSVSLKSQKDRLLEVLVSGVGQGSFIVAAAEQLSELVKAGDNAAILKNSSFAVINTGESTGSLVLNIGLDAKTVEVAQQVEIMMQGLLALAKLQHQEHPNVLKLLQACTIQRTDSLVEFEFSYPSAELFGLLKLYQQLNIQQMLQNAQENVQ
jgi:hypothetical protein